jgi:hypothetical protein
MPSMIRTLWNRLAPNPRFLGGISLLLLVGILIACLWPFRAPRNTASWLAGRPGIAFGSHGVLLSSDQLTVAGDRETASCSLELWLESDGTRDMGSILAIYSPENPRQFTVSQWRTGLALRSVAVGDPVRMGGAPSFTSDVFTPGKTVFVTITSSERGTEVYVGGNLLNVTHGFHITNGMLTGKVVAGTAASADDNWGGQLRGLAIYNRALNPAQVRNHYTTWTSNGRPGASDLDGLLALYLFKESTGRTVHSEVPGGSDLYVPERYVVPAKDVLSAPTLDNWDDIIKNIVGFLPFGFTLCGYFVSAGRRRSAVVVTTVICGALSLFVESLQAFLPTRDSSMTDVLTNLLGGAIGALLYHWADSRWNVGPGQLDSHAGISASGLLQGNR